MGNAEFRNCESYRLFGCNIPKFIRPSSTSIFNCQNIIGIKLVTKLHLGLTHLREHKFNHSFQDSLNPPCNCDMDVESSTHFILECPFFLAKDEPS